MTAPLNTPTQVKHPWRATLRTLFAGAVGFLPLVPEVLADVHLDVTAYGAQAILVAGLVTRFLAKPAVEAFLSRFAPWLTAAPTEKVTA